MEGTRQARIKKVQIAISTVLIEKDDSDDSSDIETKPVVVTPKPIQPIAPKSILKRSDSGNADSPPPSTSLQAWQEMTAANTIHRHHHHINSSWEEWALMTGWHGVVDLFYAKTIWLKLIWFLVIAVGAFFAFNESASMVLDFSTSEKWVTSVSYREPDDGTGAANWPNMTIANLNWLGQSSLDGKNFTDPYFIAFAIDHSPEAIKFYYRTQEDHQKNYKNDQELDELVKNVEKNFSQYLVNGTNQTTTIQQVITGLAQPCIQTIMHCGHSLKFDLRNRDYDCCAGNTPTTRKVSSFNINPTNIFGNRTKKNSAGYKGGIYFLLDPKVYDDYSNVRIAEKPSAGFQIFLYYGDQPDTTSAALMVATGTHTVVSLQQERYRIARKRKSAISWMTQPKDCINDADYHYVYVNASGYTVSFCQEECKAKYLIDIYGCTCQTIDMNQDSYQCDNKSNATSCLETWSNIDKSIQNREKSKYLSPRGTNVSKCMEDCLTPCDYYDVGTKISSAEFPTPLKLGSFSRYVTKALYDQQHFNFTETAVGNFSLLELYFELNLIVTMEKMPRISIDDLISNIGGSLGVWTGISIISIVQALVYAFYGIRQLIDKIVDSYTQEEAVFLPHGRKKMCHSTHHRLTNTTDEGHSTPVPLPVH